MSARYVILVEGRESSERQENIHFSDDIHAMIVARRLFVHRLFADPARPVTLQVGRQADGTKVDWLTTWRVERKSRPRSERLSPRGRSASQI